MLRRLYALRWWMISLITIGTILNYMTRTMLGVAAPTLMGDLGITEKEYSWVTGFFQGGIMLQPVAGYVMDHIGLKLGFGLFALAWACIMMLHGAASLKLDADGFEMTNLFRHARFHWQDASGFEAQFPPVLRASAIPPPSWNKFVAFDNAKMRNSTWPSGDFRVSPRPARSMPLPTRSHTRSSLLDLKIENLSSMRRPASKSIDGASSHIPLNTQNAKQGYLLM